MLNMVNVRILPSLMMSFGSVLIVFSVLLAVLRLDSGALMVLAAVAALVTFPLVGAVAAFARRVARDTKAETTSDEVAMQVTAAVATAFAITVNSVYRLHFEDDAPSTLATVLLVAGPVFIWLGVVALAGVLLRGRQTEDPGAT